VRAGNALEQRLHTRLARLGADGLLRSLRPPAGIDLASNDYLGFSTHSLLKQRMMEAVAREGCGSTGSRLLRGERESFAAIERSFAAFKGTERSLYFSSGYMANLAVLTSFPESGDVIYSDERNHASLIDGIRLSGARRIIFPHNNVEELARRLQEETGPGQKFLVTESLFSMDGDMAPLAAYATLCRSSGTALIVDEAHAVGIYGEHGSGLVEAAGIGDDVFVSINTAGKALGVSGAFVAGPPCAIDFLIQIARPFIFSTAAPPPVAAALDASLTLLASEPGRRETLRRRAAYLRERLSAAGIDIPAGSSQIIPIVIGENGPAVAVSRDLQEAGFDVRAIRPPTVPPGTARLRISVNVNLCEDVLNDFVAALASAMRKFA